MFHDRTAELNLQGNGLRWEHFFGQSKPLEWRKTGINVVHLLDSVHNIFFHVSRIHKLLKDGINFGNVYPNYHKAIADPICLYASLFFHKKFFFSIRLCH